MTINPECLGCPENNYSCTEWSLMCPCATCLIKSMCSEPCDMYRAFQRKCNRNNKDKVKTKRSFRKDIQS